MDSQERLRLLVQRTWQLTVFLGLAFTAILVGYWYTQIVRGAYYRELAENNRLRELKIEAPRGVILDREGRALVENVPSYFLLFDRGRSANVESSLSFVSRTLERPVDELERAVSAAAGSAAYVPLSENRIQLIAGQRLRNGLVMQPYGGYDLATAGVR